ncbi:MAG: EAL domain-containing protein, partial [Pseudomonadota bacterium]
AIAAKVINVVEQIHKVEHHNLYISASIGIAVYPHHGETPELLLQHADVAMYMAKRSNQPFAFYDTTQDSYSVQQLALLGELREAFENDTLDLYYQPKFSTHEERVTGVEGLLRWNHPKHGLILPGEIIPLAERTGVIKYLTHWVLNAALRQCSLWREQGHTLSVSVNLSVHDLQEPGLPAKIGQFLELWEVPPHQLELEITESVMMSHPERAKTVLDELGNLGVLLSIDDYGSGYSSLAYIKSLPVDTLKIDKSFILDMVRDENDATIVHSTIELAHNLGFRVCAEGVENEATWNRLVSQGCDCLQGFYLSGPMAPEELGAWLNTNPQRAQNA